MRVKADAYERHLFSVDHGATSLSIVADHVEHMHEEECWWQKPLIRYLTTRKEKENPSVIQSKNKRKSHNPAK